MKFIDEYRDGTTVKGLVSAIRSTVTRQWTLMEVCGGQTHAIVRYGLGEMLPPEVDLVHGPGCPVCVTALETIDRAHAIASRREVIFCSFGDMLRVPGSREDLLSLKARGSDIRVVYSPLDAIALARRHPEREVVFFAIGFETTAPANAMVAWLAGREALRNFSLLVSHVCVPPVVSAIFDSPGNRVQGLLGPGHVCTVMGFEEYEPLAERYRIPIVITGFEPVDLLEGVLRAVRQLEAGRFVVENQYARAVSREGNLSARKLVEEVFEVCDRKWRGLGSIPRSGLRLSPAYGELDAERRFNVDTIEAGESEKCMSGEILKGLKKPKDCPAFGTLCTPEAPLGATMVSSEGACAAYYAYGRGSERMPS